MILFVCYLAVSAAAATALPGKMVDTATAVVADSRDAITSINQTSHLLTRDDALKNAPCVDSNVQCPTWAKIGECQNNPAYMLKSCRKSCGTCGVSVTMPAVTPASGVCEDLSKQYCPIWAKSGECKSNPNYMLSKCKKSCGKCEVPCEEYSGAHKLELSTAMHGYDIWHADPWGSSDDPGVRGRILLHKCKTKHSTDGYYGFINVRADLRCKVDFDMSRVTSYSQYVSAVQESSGGSSSIDASLEVNTPFGGGGVKYSYSKVWSHEQSKMREFFEDKHGEVSIAKALCHTDDVDIVTESTRPVFHSNFINTLKKLNKVLSQTATEQEKEFKIFIEQFGTHFNDETDFGAALIHRTLYKTRSKTSKEADDRKDCSKEASSLAVSANGGAGGYTASAEVAVKKNTEECLAKQSSSDKGSSSGVEKTATLSLGSQPESLDKWATADRFKPVPITRKLKLISTLFKNEYLTKSEVYGFSEDLNGSELEKLFNKMAREYCHIMLGYSKIECAEKLVGCGLNDDCGFDFCINEPATEKGYKCIPRVDAKWSAWSSWSSCTGACGSGKQRRSRTCELPQYGGKACPTLGGLKTDTRPCTSNPCYGSWSGWSNSGSCNYANGCSRSQRQVRTCNYPSGGGRRVPCSGSSSRSVSCTLKATGPPPHYKCPCGKTFIGSGNIYSPGWPHNYPNNMDCTFYIRPSGWRLRLRLLSFEIEDSSDRNCYDYLSTSFGYGTVGWYNYAGKEKGFSSGYKFCKSQENWWKIKRGHRSATVDLHYEYRYPIVFGPGHPDVTVKFHTDGSQTRKGFHIYYTS